VGVNLFNCGLKINHINHITTTSSPPHRMALSMARHWCNAGGVAVMRKIADQLGVAVEEVDWDV